MPVQVQLNARSAFDPGAAALPVFFSASEVPASFSASAPTLAAFSAAGAARPFQAAGFLGSVTGFPAVGEGIYHSGSLDLNQRMWHGVLFRANYTFAKNIDNATNELFSSLVNPRRPEDGNHMELERGRSVLDIRHKVAVSFMYEVPKYNGSGFLKPFLNGWQLGGTWIIQSGQPVTARSGLDANGNKDSAGDRAIFNPKGTANIGTATNFVCRDPGTGASSIAGSATACGGAANVVGYVAIDPNARYVQARPGAKTNIGRDTLDSPGLNNWNLSFFKNTNVTERVYVQFRAELFNAFNHRQFSFANSGVLGLKGDAIDAEDYSLVTSSQFLDPKQLNGGARSIQLGLKLFF